MAVSSTMLPLGTELPDFSLPNLDGQLVAAGDLRGTLLVVAFICPHCPYVRHIGDALAAFAREYAARGLKIVAINANDAVAYPQDGPDGMRAEARASSYTFPYLRDEGQDTAKAFHAACTPEFFLFDRHGRLAYRGQFDSSRPKSGIPVTGDDLRAAADAVLAGKSPAPEQHPAVGCSIKWRI